MRAGNISTRTHFAVIYTFSSTLHYKSANCAGSYNNDAEEGK